MANIIHFPKSYSLSSDEQKILKNQVITEQSPGTVLHDFEVLLDMIGESGVRVSPKNSLLPMDLLTEINSKMATPIITNLKRPSQRSYPHINALYLLLRASGLTRIRNIGKNKMILTDKEVYQSWKSLNPCERYFTLLESWLLRGTAEVIGEGRGGIFGEPILKWEMFFKNIPAKGLKVAGNEEASANITYFVGTYTIGILDLFGFITVKPAKTEPGKGWQIEKIQKTLFGSAMLNLMTEMLLPKEDDSEDMMDFFARMMEADEEEPSLDLKTILRPFFPEWQNSLRLPDYEFKDGVYEFKVSLGKKKWRKIAVPGNSSFDDLSSAILNAFRFDSDHLYEFVYKNQFGHSVRFCHPYMEDEDLLADEVRIGDLPLQIGDEMEYHYDFGDDWRFNVLLESVEPPNRRIKKARIIESQGDAPEQYWHGEDDDMGDDEE